MHHSAQPPPQPIHSSPNLAPPFVTGLPCTHSFGTSCPLRRSSSPLDAKGLCQPLTSRLCGNSQQSPPKIPPANLCIGWFKLPPNVHIWPLIAWVGGRRGDKLSQLLWALPAPFHCPPSFLFLPTLRLCQVLQRALRKARPWGKGGVCGTQSRKCFRGGKITKWLLKVVWAYMSWREAGRGAADRRSYFYPRNTFLTQKSITKVSLLKAAMKWTYGSTSEHWPDLY